MTWANAVTLARLGLTPVLILAFLWGPAWLFFALFALIMVGDLLDGALARWQGHITDLGKALDPLVDKVLFTSLFIALAIKAFVTWELVILIAIPQLALLVGGVVLFQRWKLVIEARWSGKLATLVLALGLLALLVEAKLQIEIPWAYEITYAGVSLSYAAGFDYLLNALRLVRR